MSHHQTFAVKRLIITLLGLAIVLSACNLPRGTPTLSEMDLISTQAAQTVAAQLTEISRPPATSAPSTATVVVPTQSTPQPTFAPRLKRCCPVRSLATRHCHQPRRLPAATLPSLSKISLYPITLYSRQALPSPKPGGSAMSVPAPGRPVTGSCSPKATR